MTEPKDHLYGLRLERLKELLSYDPNTGLWSCLQRRGNSPCTGPAGTLRSSGYITIDIGGHRYRAHRLAWFYMTGFWPNGFIDHKDGIRSNNKWENLRIADNCKNQANKKKHKNNTAGFKGVYWNQQRQKWAAKINPNRKQVHLGFFDDPEQAHLAYQEGARKFFGAFARS